jgi:hypothetical protein
MARLILVAFVLSWTVALSAQTASPFQPQGSLAVVETAPLSLQVASAGTAVSIRFSHSVKPSSVGAETFRVRGERSGPVSGHFLFSDLHKRVTFVPERPFQGGETVWVHLANRIAGVGARRLRNAGHAFQFRIAVAPTSGTLTPYASLANDATTFPTRISAMTAGDLDHDGSVDFVTTNDQIHDLRGFLNLDDGTGTFAGPVVTSSVGESPASSILVDLDGDPFLDLVTVDIVFDKKRVFLGVGNGGFLEIQVIDDAAGSLVALDIDGDADLDLAATRLGGIVLYENDGSGGFVLVGSVEGGVPSELLLAAGDMNQDGITDLICTGHGTDDLRTALGDGNKSFHPAGLGAHATGGEARTLALGDIDGDGDLDVAVGNAGNDVVVGILRNLGNGVFSSLSAMDPEGSCRGSGLGDLDGDGDLDWVVTVLQDSFTSYCRIYRNQGDGSFAFVADAPATSSILAAVLADTDRDGDLDLAFADPIEETIELLRNE